MSLKQIKYHPSHMAQMDENAVYGDNWLNKYDIYEMSKEGGVRTIIDQDNNIVAIAGIRVVDKVGIVWIKPSKLVQKYKISFARMMKKHMDRFEEVLELEKIQSMCYKIEQRAKFLEWLGFEYIGLWDMCPEFAVFEKERVWQKQR